jgi:hypothetical protein
MVGDDNQGECSVPRYLFSYDLRDEGDPHDEFLAQAIAQNWSTWMPSDDGRHFKLPFTTLVGLAESEEAALSSLRYVRAMTEAVLRTPVIVRRYILVAMGDSTFQSDRIE